MQGKRILYLTLGWLSLITGIIGIFLPLLPTTSFVLLAAWCFSKSSKRFHTWLLEHSFFGPIIKNWQLSNGIPRRSRNRAIIFIWIGMSVSIFMVWHFWATIGLIIIGLCISIYLMRLPLRPEISEELSSEPNSTNKEE